MIYLKLFFAFFQVGLFSFGGGYASLPLIQNQVVHVNEWISADEFTNLISISQLTPGAIAINASTFVGTRVGGLFGAICATIGCALPSTVIVLLLLWIYTKYKSQTVVEGAMSAVRPTIIGLILAAGISMLLLSFTGGGVTCLNLDIVAIVIAIAGFIVLRKTKCSPFLLMIISGAVGLGAYKLIDYIKGV